MEATKRKREVSETKSTEVEALVFHKNCPDGFASACACYMYYQESDLALPIFIGLAHSDPFPAEQLTGKRVAIFDFSFKRDVMMRLLDICASLVLWDHHDTAEKELVGLPHCHFSKDESGCILAWKFFFGKEKIPMFFRYVDDADRWQWKLEDSKNVSAGAYSDLEFNFDDYMEIIDDESNEKIGCLARSGKNYLKVIKRLGEGKAKVAKEIQFLGYKARVVNCPFFVSHMCDMILSTHPTCQVAVVWEKDHRGDLYRVHLRSREGEPVDVGNMAARLGGGGHVHASGFSLSGKRSIEELWT